jgi:Regulator of competence-specific genes
VNDDAIRDLFASLEDVTIRPMFGGKGIYSKGLIVAVEVNHDILLKAAAMSAPAFEAAGSRQWTYQGKKQPVRMPYWSIPEAAIDDPDRFAHWANLAFEAAKRAGK